MSALRLIEGQDKELIDQLLLYGYFSHLHPGWLGVDDCYNPELLGLCDLEPEHEFCVFLHPIHSEAYWLVLFASRKIPHVSELRQVTSFLQKNVPSKKTSLYVVSQTNLLTELLFESGFRQADRILQLSTDSPRITEVQLPVDMTAEAFDEGMIAELMDCELSFPPLWRIAPYELRKALQTATLRRRVVKDGKTLAYILGISEHGNHHILRLAVHKDVQGCHLGSYLLTHAVKASHHHGISEYSVNTNERNAPALALYRKFGFKVNGQAFPVMEKTIFRID